MKVVLVLCPSWGIETPHLAIALLVANLRRYGYQVEVCDFNIRIHKRDKDKGLWKSEEDVHWEDEESLRRFIQNNDEVLNSFVEEILATEAKVIGFSVYNTTKILSLELAKRIKKKAKDKIIILGGQQCFSKESAEWLIKDEAVDAVIMGEGDEVLPELIGKIEKLKRIDFCPGLLYKENGKIVNCGMRPPISKLDYLPFADFSDFSLQSYDNPHQLPILSSRGCPYSCVFCSTKLFWIKYRSMTGERIFREVDYQLKRYKDIHFFTFNDHVINANMQSLSRFCDLVLGAKSEEGQNNSNWERLSWRGAAVIRTEMDKEVLKKMKEAGCIELEYGIESGSSKIRERMKKYPLSIEVVERVIRDTYEVGINVRANFMFGFPGETEEDFQETIDFLKRNREVFSQVHPSETFCHIDCGTYLINHLEEFGVSVPSMHSLYWESINGKNTYLERLRRHQIFCQLAASLNIPLSPGGHKIMLHKELFLENFLHYKEDSKIEKNKMISIKGDFPRLPFKVHWNWDIHYACNYKCTYCYFTGKWDSFAKRNTYLGVNKWIEIWNRLFRKYGSCHIHLSGGEPFIYPSFTELIIKLSERHTLEVSTNLSFDQEDFMDKIDPGKLKIDASYHPECVDVEIFLKKVIALKEKGFNISVTYVAWPPVLGKMEEYKKKFEKYSVHFIISPFRGEFQNRVYPANYTKKEIEVIKSCGGDLLTNKDYLNFQINKKEGGGRLCYMGQMYGKIYPDGVVCRCCYRSDIGILGNIIDEEFKLLDEPQPCPTQVEHCCCWKAMIVGQEDKWLPHWDNYLKKE